jgi:hypothetical protein
MEGSLRNDDILAVIQSKVPARLKEIDARMAKLTDEALELGQEKAKLERIQTAVAA